MRLRVVALGLGALLVAFLVLAQDVSLAHLGQPHQFAKMRLAQDPNVTRTRDGRPILTLSRQLTKEADHYAQELCDGAPFAHAEDITGDQRFTIYGENIGHSHDWRRFRQAFADSPGHLRNILDPRFTRLGVGVCRRGPQWFVVYRFAG